ncbi:MAG: hypothetical protein M5R42_10885 [Rhodocyclaceae bacterium]|nr:hypothetical protein [Rhodocyclaceae bacterium]
MSALSWKQYFIYQADYQHWANEALFACLDRLDARALSEPQGLFFFPPSTTRSTTSWWWGSCGACVCRAKARLWISRPSTIRTGAI